MVPFEGFPPGKMHTVRVPDMFFSDLLPEIDDLDELKITLYSFWAMQQQEGEYRYLIERELLQDERLLHGLDEDTTDAATRVRSALNRAVSRGTLLHVVVESERGTDDLYFMNTVRGRNAVRAIQNGDFEHGGRDIPIALVRERPNVFGLYEENIGALTPLIGDALRQAEQEYPSRWIEEAIRLAVERNARSWRYIETILQRWQTEGKDRGTAQQSTQAARRRYIEGEYADYIDY